MPRYNANPNEVSSTFTVLPKAEYICEVGKPKTFTRKHKETGEITQYGISYPLKVVDGEYKGKTIYYNGQEENDIGQGIHKRFQMAANGFTINDEGEKAYNEKFGGADFSYDTDSNVIGEGWRSAEGKLVKVNADINVAKDGSGTEYQKFTGFAPVTA